MFDENRAALLQDHGVPCLCGAVSFMGIKDTPDEDLQGPVIGAQSNMPTLLVDSAVIIAASIKAGVAIQVDGVAYIARNPVLLDDGAFSNIPLSKG
ncbi:hypothetical protein QN372_00800 [Undibacterium sp. RTI2.1]|uniref:hypothetical protein n=1 Tax=unclassified Undibacterium TaxID=2630295 RepID=UPI002AB357B2|nr:MULTISPECIES: hypothetical protein [unclassified Undibacterium]MDY7537675.1 hypothetical protein [Undibacterium sp. 5I1]MEB0029277.1 hypothetical protein [Undibacterium sp. RTI2.1]MEB0115585.1 hypothetical protein [Undibacterium sp. RTI2.2]MEB0256412.1 hypothetical protein [Undibacterium sp. 5I1]